MSSIDKTRKKNIIKLALFAGVIILLIALIKTTEAAWNSLIEKYPDARGVEYGNLIALKDKLGILSSYSPDGRYIDHGDGTITDTMTKLMWKRRHSYAGTGKCLNWNDSKSYVSRITTGGYNDWRLPT
ncbi:MAG: DUF1566 domain-containing protein, partial [Nitrospinota bacterium]|nr:DUF1566 domain-containing protein [Nitrospinota bacterium]